MKISEYFTILESEKTSIVGGSSSALSGANACSLALMVLCLTIGKNKYKEFEEENIKTKKELENLKNEFLKCADEDAVSFENMKNVYSMPNKSDEEIKQRKIKMQLALKECMIVPEKILELCTNTLDLLTNLTDKTTSSARSDIGAAASFIRNTIDTASLNIYINLSLIDDVEYVEKHTKKVECEIKKNIELSNSIFSSTKKSFGF